MLCKRESLAVYGQIIESFDSAVIQMDLEGNIIDVNHAAVKLYGYEREEIIGRNVSVMFYNGEGDSFWRNLELIKCGKIVRYPEMERLRKDNSKIIIALDLYPLKDKDGKVMGLFSIGTEITQYKVLEDDLKENEERYKLAMDGANDGIWDWDIRANRIYVSDKWSEVTGYEYESIITHQKWLGLIHEEDAEFVRRTMQEHWAGKTEYYKCEYRIRVKDNRIKWVLSRGKVLRDEMGNPIRMAGSITDISDSKIVEERIRHLAYYDVLTGLSNRTLFTKKLEKIISEDNRRKSAVLFIDIDNFKNINDTYGHDYGDKLLIEMSERLKNFFIANEHISRFSGDEFLILIPEISYESEAVYIAEDLVRSLGNIWTVGGKRLFVTVTVGISIYPDDGDEVNVLIKKADTAMYKAKALGKNQAFLFEDSLFQNIKNRTEMEFSLRTALTNNEFELAYQPQICSRRGRIASAEALIRWRHPERGLIMPLEFITVAEETGMIEQIGKWVLRTACMQCKSWHEIGFDSLQIGVNVSQVQLEKDDFVDGVKEILNATGLRPDALEIEITESQLMKDFDSNIKKLKELREMGVKVALDDFGTGYSSLNYLRTLPIDNIKIDKSFIDDVCEDSDEEVILEGIIRIAHKMGLVVTAEGIEEEKQRRILSKKGCDKFQGYYFSRPIPSKQIEEILKKKF